MSRIEALLTQMTLAEKLGQLTMSAADQAVTGPVVAQGVGPGCAQRRRRQRTQSLWKRARASHAAAGVEESRLHVPLFFGLDVIHGYRTLFPVPLGETASFNRELWERTAREGRARGRARRHRHDLCANAGCIARPRAGAAPWRARARIPWWVGSWRAPRYAASREMILLLPTLWAAVGQALLRLRSRPGRPRVCFRGYLRAHGARSTHATLRGCHRWRCCGGDAGVHRPGRDSHDGAPRNAARLVAANGWDSMASSSATTTRSAS